MAARRDLCICDCGSCDVVGTLPQKETSLGYLRPSQPFASLCWGCRVAPIVQLTRFPLGIDCGVNQ